MERGGCNVHFEVRYWHCLDRKRKITKDFSQATARPRIEADTSGT
jgi:hypothetical protein